MGRRLEAGRRGALPETRELAVLLASLSEAGDSLSAEAVASRLGVPRERAEKLIDLVMSAADGDARLPLVEDGPGEVTMVAGGRSQGRALRLTRAEALALVAALERVGIGADDPVRRGLEDALLSAPVDEGLVARLLGTSPGRERDALMTCARAILSGHVLEFRYRGAADDAPAQRRAVPRSLSCAEGSWYLDAWDEDRRSGRTFRLDRMEGVEEGGAPQGSPGDASPGAREVRIAFLDPTYLDVLPWHDLTLEGRDGDGAVVGRTPYYGGDWLPRMIAACGGTARTDDAELAERARRYALGQLSRAHGRRP